MATTIQALHFLIICAYVLLALPGCTWCIGGNEMAKVQSAMDISGGADEAGELAAAPVKPATVSPELVTQLQLRQRIKQRRLFLIQKYLLEGTALKTRPNVTLSGLSKADREEIEKKLIENLRDDDLTNDGRDDESQHIKRIQTLLPSCSPPASLRWNTSSAGPSNKDFRLFFNVILPERTQVTETIKVKSANLYLLKRKVTKAGTASASSRGKEKLNGGVRKRTASQRNSAKVNNKWKVGIHFYSRPFSASNALGGQGPVMKTVPLGRNSNGWLKINIARVVEQWNKAPYRNAGLQVTVSNGRNRSVDPFQVFHYYTCNTTGPPPVILPFSHTRRGKGGVGGKHQISTIFLNNNHSTNSPHLEIVTMVIRAEDKPARIKTTTTSLRDIRKERHLEKESDDCTMESDFQSLQDVGIGWSDRIIAPRGFTTGICHGTCHRCRHSRDPGTSNATRIETSDSRSCCRPIRTQPLTVIQYTDGDVITLSQIPDLIVTNCGCH